MEPKLQVLNLFLSELGEEFKIDSLDDRLRLQKAVYIGQLFDVDLGYRYSWYVKGPYSPQLTQDYFKLKEEQEAGAVEGNLRPEIKARLAEVKSFLVKPANVALGTAQWYELLASLHYLYKISGLTRDKVLETIARTKSHLSEWVSNGEQHLRNHQKLT